MITRSARVFLAITPLLYATECLPFSLNSINNEIQILREHVNELSYTINHMARRNLEYSGQATQGLFFTK